MLTVIQAAFILPLSSGSTAAARGVITEMLPSSKRVDALQAITLLDQLGTLATVGLCGFFFAFFTSIGKPSLTFYLNAVCLSRRGHALKPLMKLILP
jgi:hypothetical protein